MARAVHSARYQAFLIRLRHARMEAGLTQRDVAQALDKPQSYVSKCESGERRVDVVELQAFAALYGCPIDSFLPEL
ncbi:MAG: helix-turn-helix transcriptional regulator [Planctomycetes bacterium]|nr:helix-turn-helix transcriptional regulator [Planctomycetota bacterium]